MPRFNEIINNFINGEVTPKLYGRSDSEIYKRSCRKLLNSIIHPQGGGSRRSGSQFMLDRFYALNMAKLNIDEDTRIIPFNYDESESYLIIFHANGNDSDYFVYIYNIQDDTISIPFFNGGSSAGWPYDSIGAGTNVSANAMTDGDTLREMQYAQNGKVIYFSHPDMPPFYIARSTKNNFVLADFYRPFFDTASLNLNDRLWQSWPYKDYNLTTTTVTPSASALGATTLTASGAIFSANLVGTPIVITNSGVTGVVLLTGFTSTTIMTGTVVRVLPGIAAYATWAFSAWSKVEGYPKCVTFYDGRTVWAGTSRQPEKVWFSQQFDIVEMSNFETLTPGQTVTTDDPGSMQVLATEINAIKWLRGGVRNLLIGTGGREFAVSVLSGTAGEIEYKSQTSFGSEAIQPVMVDDVPVFVQSGFRKLREMEFDYRVEGYTAPDVTFFAEHMPRLSQDSLGDTFVSKIRGMAYQALDNNVLWVIDNNGYLFACTKDRENAVTAFHRHELGGDFGDKFPRVLSIACVKSPNGTSDDLWMVVKRTINATTKIYLEKIGKEFYGTSLHSNLATREGQPVFVDCAKILRPATANFWAKLKTSSTATKAGGSGTGTTTGSISYTNEFAETTGAPAYIDWDGTSNADFAQTGCVRFTVHYDYSLTTFTATLLAISQANGNTNNLIEIIHQRALSGGIIVDNIILTINNSAGAAIINAVTLGDLRTYFGTDHIGKPLTFELNYGLTTGATRLFVNGKQIGSTIASTGTRNTTIDLIRINADESGNNSLADLGYDNLVIFNTVQHTADHEIFEHVESGVSITELDYLESESVGVLANGNYVGDETVTSGAMTLDSTYTTIIVGLKYRHTLEIQAIDAGTGIGSSQGSIKRIDRAVIRFNKTAATEVGPSEASTDPIIFRDDSTPIGDPIELVTDDKIIDFDGDYDRQARIVITGTDPLPCNVTCIVLRGVTGDV